MKTGMLNADGTPNQLVIPDLDAPSLYTKTDAQRRAAAILRKFENVPRTESAFYLAFCRLPQADRVYMLSFWNARREFELFVRLCRLHGVRAA